MHAHTPHVPRTRTQVLFVWDYTLGQRHIGTAVHSLDALRTESLDHVQCEVLAPGRDHPTDRLSQTMSLWQVEAETPEAMRRQHKDKSIDELGPLKKLHRCQHFCGRPKSI